MSCSYHHVLLVHARGTKQHNPWTKEEKDKIFKHLGNCIKKKILPGKSECLKCIEQSNGVLANRQWSVVKDCVRNIISRAKTLQEKKLLGKEKLSVYSAFKNGWLIDSGQLLRTA